MRKTIREWLEQLPEPYRSRAIGQIDTWFGMPCGSIHNVADAISWFADWNKTKEGAAYWTNLCQRAEDGEFDRPAEQPTAFPDELSVARAQVVKLAAENADLRERVQILTDLLRIKRKD